MVRRVFRALPDPLPDAAAIRAAFKADPEYKVLTGRNADRVMQNIVERCRYNGWKIPEAIGGLEHWGTLFVKWHWYCTDRLKLVGPNALPRQWEGKPKAIVEKAHPLLQPPKKRKPSRNYWFDHAPFRMMFGNQTCGMSWLKDGFAASRTFILLNGDSPRIGIVPRNSRFCPYTLPDAQPDEASYLLYEELQGEAPRLRAVPKERIDIPTRRGLVFLFEFDGKGLRGSSNLNALYLRALFSPENLASRDIHLDGNAEFHVRKGTDIPRDDKPEHFRQRFTEDRFFVTLRLTFNAQMASTGAKATSFGNLANYIAANPEARFINVSGEAESFPLRGSLGTFVGALARRVIAEDACVLFAPDTPKRVLKAVREKFEYIALKDRAPTADGGALRGYQLADRLFVGDLTVANEELRMRNEELKRREAEEVEAAAKAARKAENRAKAEAQRQLAARRRRAIVPDFSVAPFQTGAFRFKVEFKTSDNVRHEAECRADSRDEMFAKARTVGVRPSRVTQLDPAPTSGEAESLPLQQWQAQSGEAASSPLQTIAARLQRLDALKAQGLVSEAEYAAQRTRILGEL